MTTASNEERAASPSAATANGTSMKPPCAIEEYASMRTMFVWRRAARFPRIIEAAASTQSTGCQLSGAGKKPKNTTVRIATNPPALDETERNAVTGVGAPSYVSGAQKWNGTALILNAKPTRVRNTATISSEVCGTLPTVSLMSESRVEPVSPNTSDMPYSMIADDNTPIR